MPPCQAVLNPPLTFEQPVQCPYASRFLDRAQGAAPRPGSRSRSPGPPRGQTRAWSARVISRSTIIATRIAMPLRRRVLRGAQDQPVRRDLAQQAGRRRDVDSAAASARSAARPVRCRSPCRPSTAPADHRRHRPAIPFRLASVCSCARPSSSREALPQQNCRRRSPVGHRLDEHAPIESHSSRFPESHMDTPRPPNLTRRKDLVVQINASENFGLCWPEAHQTTRIGHSSAVIIPDIIGVKDSTGPYMASPFATDRDTSSGREGSSRPRATRAKLIWASPGSGPVSRK